MPEKLMQVLPVVCLGLYAIGPSGCCFDLQLLITENSGGSVRAVYDVSRKQI